jgi:hypothetical protein
MENTKALFNAFQSEINSQQKAAQTDDDLRILTAMLKNIQRDVKKVMWEHVQMDQFIEHKMAEIEAELGVNQPRSNA